MNSKTIDKTDYLKKIVEENTTYDPTEVVNPFNLIGRFKQMRLRAKARQTFLINMELFNGKHIQFQAVVYNKVFKYRNGFYLIDDNAKYENLSANMWALDYHEGIAIPIRRRIDYNKLRKGVELSGLDVENTIEPVSLRHFVVSEFIQKIMQGEELDKLFKLLKVVTIVTACICLLHLILFMQKSGMLRVGFG